MKIAEEIQISKEGLPVVDNDEICRFIKEKLTDSSITEEDIAKILDLEMEFLESKGLVE